MRVLPFHSVEDADAAAPTVIPHLRKGGIIAYPTETVYGYGSLLHPHALRHLAEIKDRDENRSFLIRADDPERLPGLHWTEAARLLATSFWPGPLTLALRADAGPAFPSPVRSSMGTVAVRATPLPALRRLLHALGAPLTSTSANLAGSAPAMDVDELRMNLRAAGARDVLILDGGALRASKPSTIVDCSGERPRLIRAGAVPTDQLRTALVNGGFDIDV